MGGNDSILVNKQHGDHGHADEIDASQRHGQAHFDHQQNRDQMKNAGHPQGRSDSERNRQGVDPLAPVKIHIQAGVDDVEPPDP